MNEIEDLLISELYFVIPFDELVNSLAWDKTFEKTLIELLKREWVVQLQYDNQKSDFIKLNSPDLTRLSTYSYLATKKGLLEHNGL